MLRANLAVLRPKIGCAESQVWGCLQAHTALSKPQLAGCDARYSGSTACMALVHDGQLFLANVGDSRAMLARLNPLGRIQGIPLTQDNKPDDPEVTHLPSPPPCTACAAVLMS
jgi:serine/threonine protein phosphatase PrpC